MATTTGHCPICHGLTSALTGYTPHDVYCPNRASQLGWTLADVTADDARVMRAEDAL